MRRSVHDYTPRLTNAIPLTPEQRDFLRRRTLPFVDSLGVDRPLSFLLQEVYLQGVRDAVQVIMQHDART